MISTCFHCFNITLFEAEYTVTIPDGVEFSKFLADDLIVKPSTAQYCFWITGFKSQTEAMIGSA